MSKNLGLIDRGINSNRKVANFTYGTLIENYFPGSPVALPIAEPGTATVSFTVTLPMLISCSLADVICGSVPFVVAGGINTMASAINISYRVLKNGVSQYVSGATSILANNYWTVDVFRISSAIVGDVIDLRIWGSATGLNLTYNALMMHMYGMKPLPKIGWMDAPSVTMLNSMTLLQGNSPSKYPTTSYLMYISGSPTGRGMWFAMGNTYSVGSIKFDPSVNQFGIATGSQGGPSLWSTALTHASYMPYYHSPAPTSVMSWGEIQI